MSTFLSLIFIFFLFIFLSKLESEDYQRDSSTEYDSSPCDRPHMSLHTVVQESSDSWLVSPGTGPASRGGGNPQPIWGAVSKPRRFRKICGCGLMWIWSGWQGSAGGRRSAGSRCVLPRSGAEWMTYTDRCKLAGRTADTATIGDRTSVTAAAGSARARHAASLY